MSWCGCSNWDDRRQIQRFDAALIQVWLGLLPFLCWQWLLTLYNRTKFWHIEHVCMGIGQNIHKAFFFFSCERSYVRMLLCKCHCCLCCARETIWSCWIEERSCFLHIGHNNSCGNKKCLRFFFFSSLSSMAGSHYRGESDTMSSRLLEPEVDSYEWRFASVTHGTELCALGLRMQALTALTVTSSADFSNQTLITMAHKKTQAHNRPGIILLRAVQKSISCPSCFPVLNLPDYNSPAV